MKYIKSLLFFLTIISLNLIFSQKDKNYDLLLTETNKNSLYKTGFIRSLATEMDHLSRQQYPERGTIDEFESWLAPLIQEYNLKVANGYKAPLITIPILFHIITDGSGQDNLPETQIQAQVEQLNIDFRNLAGSIDAVAADIEIKFCLVALDPSDNILTEPSINRINTYGDGPFTAGFV